MIPIDVVPNETVRDRLEAGGMSGVGVAEVHEAGHAVVAHVLGHPLDIVSTRGDSETLGRCALLRPRVHPEFDLITATLPDTLALEQLSALDHRTLAEITAVLARRLRERAAIYLAGAIAESRGTGSYHPHIGGKCDTERALELLEGAAHIETGVPGLDDDALADGVCAAAAEAATILRKHWPAVRTLAETLRSHRELAGQEAHELISSCLAVRQSSLLSRHGTRGTN